MKQNLRSEAAIKRVINYKPMSDLEVELLKGRMVAIYIKDEEDPLDSNKGEIIAILDLREIIKKRKPLTGIKKQVDKIVRGGNAKQSRKK